MNDQCTCNKIKFSSRGEARKFARRVAADNGGGSQRPYECAAGVWHLTSQSPSEARQAKKRQRRRTEGSK